MIFLLYILGWFFIGFMGVLITNIILAKYYNESTSLRQTYEGEPDIVGLKVWLTILGPIGVIMTWIFLTIFLIIEKLEENPLNIDMTWLDDILDYKIVEGEDEDIDI